MKLHTPDPLAAPRRGLPTRCAVLALGAALAALVAACGGGGGGSGGVTPPPPPPPPVLLSWLNHGGNAQHSAQGTGSVSAQTLARLAWRADVDLAPTHRENLLTSGHYGSPIITSANTVLLPVRTSATGTYRIEARDGGNGSLRWQVDTDFIPLNKNYSYSIAATSTGRVYYPGRGGKLYYRDSIDSTPGAVQTLVFYGLDKYDANKAAVDAAVVINTPVTTDSAGNAYFGFNVSTGSPAGLAGGLVRIDATGKAVWIAAATATGDTKVSKVANSAAPALSPDGKTVYAVMTTAPTSTTAASYLVALDSTTLTVKSKVLMVSPEDGGPVLIAAGGTSSPMVGPDGDVYYGVLANSASSARNSIGWLLHYDAALATTKTPGGFGWDNTPTVVPASAVGGYTGNATYLLAMKYNSYDDGQHRMAVLDPNAVQNDRFLPNVKAMKEVITILSPTPESAGSPYLHEWCVNTAAFDPNTKSVFMNNSDGYLYRWDLATNKLSEKFNLNTGYYQAYTPTALGPDGKVYAVNNAVLMAVGK